ncbi:hypothetical protein EVAR_30492_1 [Eumeta japonica]|uniref:Uncharacterized protein n=1 Tax=Eumeta variegata TaxID=151549 RepID=A0A4C1VXB5_EUMVA|nr:hypothetical protein EVAR_30492_1 [Eumeta japonica]
MELGKPESQERSIRRVEFRPMESKRPVRSFVGLPHPICGCECGTEDLPHARASSCRGYNPDGPVVMAPFQGSKLKYFPRQPEIKRSCQWVHRHRPRPSRPSLGVMVKWKGAPRTRGGAERGERTRLNDACSADGCATDTRYYASSRRAGRGQPARGRRFTRNYITVTTVFRVSLRLLSLNEDDDALQIRIEVDQCGGCTKRASPSAVGCFSSSPSSFFSVGRYSPCAAVRLSAPPVRPADRRP